MTTPGDARPLLDHEYDGIREYDNPMPRWWVLLFVLTIVFAPVYYLAPGTIGAGAKKEVMYAKEMAAWRAAHPEGGGAAITAGMMAAAVGSPPVIGQGKVLFAQYCVPCHRADAGGLIGPNLTDDYWIHGGTPLQVRTTIDQGVLAMGMPQWGKVLKPDQITALAAYVKSLRGSNPPNPKPPQGTLVVEKP